MMMRFLLSFVSLLVLSFSYAQQFPPYDIASSYILETSPQLVEASLIIDTLNHRKSRTIEHPDLATYFTADTNRILGHGYLTADGRPAGLWKYYTLQGDEYQLFCEGYYLKADTSSLLPPKLKSSEFAQWKAMALESANDKLMHCGEWLFYKEDKLTRRLFLANKARLELEAVPVFNDKGEQIGEKHVMPNKWRLIGDVLVEEEYDPNGKLKSVRGKNGYQNKLSEDGKVEIPAMSEY